MAPGNNVHENRPEENQGNGRGHAQHAVIENHEQNDENQADDSSLDTGVQRLQAQCCGNGFHLDILQGERKLAGCDQARQTGSALLCCIAAQGDGHMFAVDTSGGIFGVYIGRTDNLIIHHNRDIIAAVSTAGHLLCGFCKFFLALGAQINIDIINIEARIVHIAISHAGPGQIVAGQNHVTIGIDKCDFCRGTQHLDCLFRIVDIGNRHDDTIIAGQIYVRLSVAEGRQTFAQHRLRSLHPLAQFLG